MTLPENPWFMLICLVWMTIQTFIQCFNARRLGKNITYLCDNCFAPKIEGETHSCNSILSDKQLHALAQFIELIKGGDDNATTDS